MGKTSTKRFWNEAAEDNPYWYVSSYGPYNSERNLDEFWASGKTIWRDIKGLIGFTPQPNHVVVEIGCGVGRLTRAIAPEVGRVIALDISERMLEIARHSSIPNAEFHVAEGFSLRDIPSGSADLALAYCVFQHLPSHAALKSYLNEMCRVTKSGGLIAFTLTPRNWMWWLLPALRARAYLRERLSRTGPKGLHRKEWVGIRPGSRTIASLSPIGLECHPLDSDRTLYFGRYN